MRQLTALALAVVAFAGCDRLTAKRNDPSRLAAENGMSLTSPAFGNNGVIPRQYTCDGAGASPPLTFSGVPARAVTLALVVEDIDAKQKFVNWSVWNIPPTTTEVPPGRPPLGSIQGMSGYGRKGWAPPCPLEGEHRYMFKLLALDAPVLGSEMATHAIAEARLLARYRRSAP